MELLPLIFANLSLIFIVNSLIINDDLLKNDSVGDKHVTFVNRTRRTVVVLDKTKLWKNGIIPYNFTYLLNGRQQRLIKIAMREWEQSTCVQFVPWNPQIHQKYLIFTKTEACSCCFIDQGSKILYKTINLEDQCFRKSYLLHELGHAIGFYHEHDHPERDYYITVNYSRIEEDDVIEYEKYSYSQVDTLNLPYDSLSIMHYPQYVVFDNNSKDSVRISIPPPENLKNSFYSRNFIIINNELSDGDKTAANLMYHCPKCGKTFFEPTGTFEVSSNGSDEDPERCEWIIRAAEGERIIFRIAFLNILTSYNCLLDYLEIRNGHSPDSPVLGHYCGEMNETKITASNFLVVTYVKMSLYSQSLFKAEYETTCDRIIDIYNDTVYNFESPNYPESYMPNKRCLWNFIAPENDKITIKFNYFALEKTVGCRNDYVKIEESKKNNSKVIGVYCGVLDFLYVYSTGNELYVEFSSNRIIEHYGFSATASILKT